MSRKFDRNQSVVNLLCVVFVLASLGLLIHGLLEFGRARRSPAWPTVKGTVFSSTTDGGSCDVLYTYQFDRRTFQGNHVGFGNEELMSDSNDAHRVVRRYPKGKIVDVYYDPADPEISVLEPGIRPGTYNEMRSMRAQDVHV